MDMITSCKDKLGHFRVKELKDVLTQLGLSKQGRKQDLVDRILAVLSDEQGICPLKIIVGKKDLAKLIDGIFRKMQDSGATDQSSKSKVVSNSSNVKLKGEAEDAHEMKIQCPCGSSLQAEAMIQCEDKRCCMWQHLRCVIITEKSMENGALSKPPEPFYCELCRLSRADPFLVTMASPLYPTKLAILTVPISADSTSPVQRVEKTFQLTRADRDLLAKQEYDVQAWCILLNDKVQFRMQWPQYAELQVNGVLVRCINRPGSQLLGANGRDDGPIITPWSRDGINKIMLTGCDARVFCLGVRLVKRRSLQQILNLIPKETEGEVFDDALARVRRCVGGGTATENADSDNDLEVVADFIPVNLRCPMSGSRMKIAGRFKPCVHMGCFDLEVFVGMNQRSRKWQCPICLKNYSLEHVIIDPYFNRITSQLQTCGDEVTEIEVKPDGSWRAKAEGDPRSLGDLGRWHLPDGSLIIESQEKVSNPKPVKPEGGLESRLKVGLKKNQNGLWEINKTETFPSLSENFEHHVADIIIPMSSSSGGASGSGKDGGEDRSINKNADFSNNRFDLETISPNLDPTYGLKSGDAEVIVLSDSDEENEPVISLPGQPRVSASHHALFNANDDGFEMNLWPLPSINRGDAAGFEFFGSDTDVSGSLVDAQHGSANGYSLAADTGVGGSCSFLPESSVDRPNAEINDGLVNNNPLPLSGNDPSLQLFPPTRPSDAFIGADTNGHRPRASNGSSADDWISLRLGINDGSTVENGLSSGHPSRTNETSLDPDSLRLGVNGGVSTKSSRERFEGPFNFPRQRRSVRPRLYFSVDSDSE